jgi:hypothetical protein
MRMTGSKTEHGIVFDVDPDRIFELTLAVVAEAFDVGVDWYEEDGKLFEDVEHHTSHSWDSKELRVAEPTESMLHGVRALAVLKKAKRDGALKRVLA